MQQSSDRPRYTVIDEIECEHCHNLILLKTKQIEEKPPSEAPSSADEGDNVDDKDFIDDGESTDRSDNSDSSRNGSDFEFKSRRASHRMAEMCYRPVSDKSTCFTVLLTLKIKGTTTYSNNSAFRFPNSMSWNGSGKEYQATDITNGSADSRATVFQLKQEGYCLFLKI
ncbi:hypothetical protein HDE_00645 [Halotydeus destructor]|nr:hypothetical protein HDE_00645 [Halotydeus destructor]